ncbi:MAG: AAA family ATPase, partial [Boseongicola sp. SB0673_bin_14]|nr:AAA family ATPase [Boseongicola sp. SB0673_bin_14]
SETLQRWLARHGGIAEGRGTAEGLKRLRAANDRTILVVDDSSLASSVQVRDLLRVATTLRIPRVVLVGDGRRPGAEEAGKPFAQLRAAGMTAAVMDDIVRQRDAELKAAVRASLATDVKAAFAKLGGNVRQADRDGLATETARLWLGLSPELRERTWIAVPTRALRDGINAIVRERLVAEGTVSGPAMEVDRLVPRDLARAGMARASSYRVGDTVIFNRPYKTLGVERGDERRVASVDRRWGAVRLEDAEGNLTPWRPERLAAAKGGVEAFRSETTELRRGDRIRFTRDDPALVLASGDTVTVESVDRDGVRLRLEDGSVTWLGRDDPLLRHVDRAFAATVDAIQGRTVDRIVAAMPAGDPRLTYMRTFCAAISRARDAAVLVTDDAHRLADRLERATGERPAALDATARQAAREAVFGRGP